ncbi:MAG: AlpA family phage regulatory protein [Bacteroidota bacterium]|nr:AlpA family phage regulatory protein [Bacteroidota bacterium]
MQEDKLIKLNNVLDYVQLSKTKIYEMMKKGEFPKPEEIGGNKLWSLEKIQMYIESIKKAS